MALEELVAVDIGFGIGIECIGAERKTLGTSGHFRDHAHESGQPLAFESEAAGVDLRHGDRRLLLRSRRRARSEEHTSELQSLMRISYAVFCLKKKTKTYTIPCTHNELSLTSHIN